MNMASGSEERVISDGSTHEVDASNEGGMTSEGNLSLKKGPWTPTEDIVLMDYVSKHGEENWNAVQKHTGLAHCGKSCCLRWANHLRPDLKKGPFNEDEERLIIELHAKWGNKWARMATECNSYPAVRITRSRTFGTHGSKDYSDLACQFTRLMYAYEYPTRTNKSTTFITRNLIPSK